MQNFVASVMDQMTCPLQKFNGRASLSSFINTRNECWTVTCVDYMYEEGGQKLIFFMVSYSSHFKWLKVLKLSNISAVLASKCE
jgi:hypothetical protein